MHSLTLLSGTYPSLNENDISYPDLPVKFIVLLILPKHFRLLLIGGRFTLEERLFMVGVVQIASTVTVGLVGVEGLIHGIVRLLPTIPILLLSIHYNIII